MESSLFATVIAGGQVYTTLAAVALVSIIAYVFPARGPRVVQSDQNIYAKGQTVCSSYREACIPNAKLSMAIVFVGLHACGLLSNSYIRKLIYASRFLIDFFIFNVNCLVMKT